MKKEINKNISKSTVIIIIIIILIVIFGVCFYNESVTKGSWDDYYYSKTNNYSNYRKVSCKYSDEYDIQYISLDKRKDLSSFEVCKYMDYLDYVAYCDKWNLEKKYDYEDYNYIMFSYYPKNEYSYTYGTDSIKAELVGLKYKSKETVLYIWDGEISPTKENISAGYIITIPTKKKANQVSYVGCVNYSTYISLTMSVDKPVIYLYPTEETELSVKLGYADKITCSYPKYTTGWKVLAKPNGDLIDLDSGRSLYSLYYESTNTVDFNIKSDGFVVKGTDVAKFLEEKLEILGLTEREAEEFIVYWLPKLQKNKYNYIRFAKNEEINANMPLEFSVEPNTLIRILMIYKGLDTPIDVQEQQLETPKREGFIAVEWGGIEMNF